MPDLRLSLYENGIDSIRHGLEHYTTDDNEVRRYKYAVTHIAQGVFLLLKERLRQEHPTLINTEVTSPKKTVDVKSTLDRLKKIANVDFGASEKVIIDLAELRNGIEHHEFSVSTESVDDLICQVVPFLVELIKVHFNKDFKWTIGDGIWNALLNVPNFRTSRIATVKEYIKRNKLKAYECGECHEKTAIAQIKEDATYNVETITCQVCLYSYWLVIKCQECGKKLNLIQTKYEAMRDSRYCESCVEKVAKEFPFQIYPRFILATRRWFRDHNRATYDDLQRFLGEAESHGPSARGSRIESLLTCGIIDFCLPSQRAQYDLLKSSKLYGGHPPIGNAEFRWAWEETKKRAKATSQE